MAAFYVETTGCSPCFHIEPVNKAWGGGGKASTSGSYQLNIPFPILRFVEPGIDLGPFDLTDKFTGLDVDDVKVGSILAARVGHAYEGGVLDSEDLDTLEGLPGGLGLLGAGVGFSIGSPADRREVVEVLFDSFEVSPLIVRSHN